MRQFRGNWSGIAVIVGLSGGLLLIHAARAISEPDHLQTSVVGVLLPLFVSSVVLLSGVWLWRSAFGPAAVRRVAAWCAVGVVILSLGTLLTILYQRAQGANLDGQVFVVANSASFGTLIGSIIGLYDAQRYRQNRTIQSRERALDALHATTRELVQTSGRQAIATIAVEAAHDILGRPLNGCWFYDDAENVLTPVAITDEATDLFEELPTYTENGSLSWEAFETGNVEVFDDLSDAPNRHREDTLIRSEVILPLGEYGVMNVGSTEPGAFDEMDVSLLRILAANTETALERAEHERSLADARDQAKHLNHQLTVLNRVFRHDLRNAANVVQGHADLLVEETDGERASNSATTIREQAAGLVRMGEQMRNIERLFQNGDHERKRVDIAGIIATHLDRIRRDHPDVETDGPGVERCTVYAHPLVESAVLNVVDNAVEHNDKDTPLVEVTIAQEEGDRVEIRIADNGPGMPRDEVTVLERGYETPLEHTSGLGLWLVNWIVRESDGTVSFERRRPEGSIVSMRFEKPAQGP